jgi:FkbM family methyltransferase
MLACPKDDLGFATSKVHGETAQLELLNQVVRLCPQKRAAVDVGAHIGTWSRGLAKSFGAVLAFEPIEENFACLKHNTAGLPNVHALNLALGDITGCMVLEKPVDGNSGMWHIKEESGIGTDGEPNVRRLDDCPLKYLDLLKIDVEGFEGRVLMGAAQTVQAHKPVIVFEDNGLGQKYFGANWVNPTVLLKAWGYKLRFTWRKDRVWVPV